MQASTLVAIILGVIVVGMGIPVLRKLVGRSPAFIEDLGFSRGKRPPVVSWFIATAVALGYIAFTFETVPGVSEHWRDVSATKALAIAASLIAGIVEEGCFRRRVMDGVARTGRGSWLQIIASALVFGLAHGVWGLLGGSLSAAMGAMVSTTVLGALLGIVYLAAGRILAPCVAAHCLIDAVIEPSLLFAFVTGFHR